MSTIDPEAVVLDKLYPGRLGLLLIRCRGKRPLENGWNLDAVQRYQNGADRASHLAAIARHLAGGGSIGWAVPPGALVIDCDTPESARAVAELMRPGVPLQKTPRGVHFVAASPAGAAIKSSVKVQL